MSTPTPVETTFTYKDNTTTTSTSTNLSSQSYSNVKYSLVSVVIGTSCQSLGNDCFNGCTVLNSIVIPDSVTTIGDNCFYECNALVSIDIPASVTTIGDNCFNKCISLASIVIPDSVITIGQYCFNGCTALANIAFVDQSNFETSGNYVFSNGYNTNTKSPTVTFFSTTATTIEDLTQATQTALSSFTSENTVCLFTQEPYSAGLYNEVLAGTYTSFEYENVSNLQSSLDNNYKAAPPKKFNNLSCTFDKILTQKSYNRTKKLIRVEIGSICDTIQSECFKDCNLLSEFKLKDSRKIKSVGDNVFVGCNQMTVIFDFVQSENFLNFECKKLKAAFPKGSTFEFDTTFCFNEGTKILCLNKQLEEEYVAIENLRKGDFVKSYKHGYRRIDLIGKNVMMNNPELFVSCMYKMKKTDENGLLEDLIVTGAHSILVDDLGSFKEENEKLFNGKTYKIDDKYLLMAAVSSDFEKIEGTDKYTYYHFILENNGNNDERFGVWANGVLSETPSKDFYIEQKYIPL
jgi:hypothetical protein